MEDFMTQALQCAHQAAQNDEVPVGALVVRNGKIIASAHNLRETEQNPVAHAEVLAIQAAAKTLNSWRLDDCELWVTLEPCPMCLGALQQARIRRVIYGAQDPKGGSISLGYRIHEDQRMNHRFECVYQPRTECGEILSRFFTARRASGKQ